jgi:hypothetical protein
MDIFSLGCVCYYMLTRGRHPFGEEDNREVSTSSPYSHSLAISVGGNFHRLVSLKFVILFKGLCLLLLSHFGQR